ncbi:hypothetical protein CEXT_524071 [Caerostris extrusa]|uniref:Uncharacterized protein n=1 Tax=Caerostris extrusa TaxID=172846 RepID=A0AAV4WTC5_CAEEX|nr:hypothetical protein CEXT_524071 [Caerostris extrusa]
MAHPFPEKPQETRLTFAQTKFWIFRPRPFASSSVSFVVLEVKVLSIQEGVKTLFKLSIINPEPEANSSNDVLESIHIQQLKALHTHNPKRTFCPQNALVGKLIPSKFGEYHKEAQSLRNALTRF